MRVRSLVCSITINGLLIILLFTILMSFIFFGEQADLWKEDLFETDNNVKKSS